MAQSSEKSLVIVESPAKAKTVGRFLGSDYRVEASYGHVRDLPQNAKEIPPRLRKEPWARLGVNVDHGFEPLYVVPADKKKYVKRLKEALRGADRLLLATDEDREGESISWHVLELLKPRETVDVRRIVFHEVTPEAIRRALESPRSLNENLVRAQEARRVLDRLYGYSLSPLLWKRVAPGLSAGRVQSVAVRLLVERERARRAFRAASYWDLRADLRADGGTFQVRLNRVGGRRVADGKSFDAETGKLTATRRIHLDEAKATALAAHAKKSRPWRVSSLEKKPGQQRPSPPFITSTLQQEANRKLRFSSKRTMRIAQQLYEGVDLGGERIGLITYMRTDSVTLAERAIEQARAVIRQHYGDDYLPPKPVRYKTSSKRAQEAHEAIRPTDLSRRPRDVARFLDRDQLRLYELIWKRTLACQMVPARFERTSVEVKAEVDGEELTFGARGRRIVFPGFLRAYVEGSDEPEAQLADQETLLPALHEGQEVEPLAVEAEGHATKPPARYTEASLVKKLEEAGIGRPSTYASIIGTIQDRGYVFKKSNELVPTFTAFCVTQLLEEHFADLVDVAFTAKMEDDLDEVAAGRKAWDRLVATFFYGENGNLGLQQRLDQSEVSYPAVVIGRDPETAEPLLVKVGKYGPYLRRGEKGSEMVSLPEDLAPADLTPELALELLRGKSAQGEALAEDPVTGRGIYLRRGRFGAYLELGQTEEERQAKVKPRRVSIPRGLDAGDVTPDVAQRLIQLPRTLGTHPETGEPVTTGIGRYGPFVKHGDDFRSLKSWQEACDLDLEQALEILRQPKPARRRFGAAKTVLKELGEAEGADGPLKVLDGRYGPYVTDGKTNATLPKGTDPQSVTVEQALAWIEERRKAPPRRRRRRA
ncbi:MAG: type I DNA topoisomerase [Acidobacteria bacterium]|nr:MAG: type I DNA topoisomerase [Acidobacteriota bacterium]